MRLMRIGPVGAARPIPDSSRFMVLEPGDVIKTGPPAAVALGPPDHPYVGSGAIMELWSDELGLQRHELGAA
jgi:2-keto-4-pentenoate hydratase/2-oxohepta-3-ene-1,7-dioic acid hydratase in catechol pathway